MALFVTNFDGADVRAIQEYKPTRPEETPTVEHSPATQKEIEDAFDDMFTEAGQAYNALFNNIWRQKA